VKKGNIKAQNFVAERFADIFVVQHILSDVLNQQKCFSMKDLAIHW
jgi:hypothetical protein